MQRADLAACLVLAGLVVAASWPGLTCRSIDTPDSSMHLLDGIFFYDLFRDHPHAHLANYALGYYKQYPALGFAFWPPLFSVVLGVIFLGTGPGIFGARLCMLLFGLLFALCFYAILRRQFAPLLSFAGAAAAVALPGMTRELNQVLLELPAVAMLCLAALCYQRLLSALEMGKRFTGRAIFCGIASAAVLYTKQPGWFIVPVLAADLMVRRPRLFFRREPLVAFATLCVCSLPLCAFTLVWGRANLAQSVGSTTSSIMGNYQALSRASLAAWLYYPRFAPSALSGAVLCLACVGLVLAMLRRDFLRANVLWLAWFALSYLTFSFYDNRQQRFAAFWWPAWVALAVAAAHALSRSMPKQWKWVAPALLLLPVPFELYASSRAQYAEFSGEDVAIVGLFGQGPPGNILLVGDQVQVATALIRASDRQRQSHVIRGNKLLAEHADLAQVCARYRVGMVLVQLENPQPLMQMMASTNSLQLVGDSTFLKSGQIVHALSYRYTGPMHPVAAEVALGRDPL